MTEQTKRFEIDKVFETVPDYYDLMNNIMSFGMHHYWKDIFCSMIHPIPSHANYVDLACGTGDIAKCLLPQKKSDQTWILIDPSENMLKLAQKKLGSIPQYVCAYGENLPLASKCVHTVTLSFGLRNTTDRTKVLQEIFRTLEPGGQCLIMEFHTPSGCMKTVFDIYQKALPYIGMLVTQDSDSYAYLAHSILHHPPKEHIIDLLYASGFEKVFTKTFLNELVVIYHAIKGFVL